MELVKQFNSELSSLYETKPPISKAKMTSITRTAIKAIKLYKHVVQSVEKFIQKCKPEYKVPGLYVIDSIVRQSRHQFGTEKDVFAPRFARNLQQTFIHLFNCPPEDKSKVIRVLNLWQKNNVFESEVIQPLFDLADPNHPVHKEQAAQAAQAALAPSNGITPVKPPTTNATPKNASAKKEGGTAGWINQLNTDTHPSSVQQKTHAPGQAVDVNLIQQLQQLQTLLLDQQADNKTKSSESDQIKFDKKLLDFDYGEEEDEDGPPQHHHQQQQQVVAGLDSLGSILSNPEVLRQLQTLQQTLSNPQMLRQQQLEMEEKMRKMQEMKQQEEEFDKHLAQTVPNLPFADQCELKPGELSGFPGMDLSQPPPGYPPQQKLLMPPGMMMKPPPSPLEDGEHASSDADERIGRRGGGEEGGPSVVVLDSDSPSDSPSHGRRRRRRSRSRSRSHHRRSRSDSRSRSRSKRKRRSSSYDDKDWERSKQREAEKERERERKRKGLPPLKKNHLAVCSTTLWIGHLSKLVQQEELSDTFGEFGDIVSIDLIPPRGCAFVCMNRRQDAHRALQDLRHHKLQGKAITLAWAPGKGMKGKEYKDYWEVEQGVSYIPWTKITPDIDLELLEEGGMIDEESMPDWLKERQKKNKEDDHHRSQSSSQAEDDESKGGDLDIPVPAPTLPGYIPLPDGPQPNDRPPVSQPPPTMPPLMAPAPPLGMMPPFAVPRLLGPMGMAMGPGLMPNVPLGVPPPGMHPLMHQQMMSRMPQPVGSPFNPPPGVSLLGPQLSQIPLPGQDKSKAGLTPLGVPPPSDGSALPPFTEAMMQLPFTLPPQLQLQGMGMLRAAMGEGKPSEDGDKRDTASPPTSGAGPMQPPFGQPPPQFSPMSLMKIPPPMNVPPPNKGDNLAGSEDKDERELKDKDYRDTPKDYKDRDKERDRDRDYRSKRDRDYRGDRDYRDRFDKDYRERDKDYRDKDRDRKDRRERDEKGDQDSREKDGKLDDKDRKEESSKDDKGYRDRNDRDRSRNRDRERDRERDRGRDRKWGDRDRERGRDRERDDRRGRDRERERSKEMKGGSDRDKGGPNIQDRLRNMAHEPERGDFPRGGMDPDNFQGPPGGANFGPRNEGFHPEGYPPDMHGRHPGGRREGFDNRGPGPRDMFDHRGPPPEGFDPRGPPPEGFGPRGGPLMDNFGPRGPPPDGFGPRGPPPDGFGPRGPPPDGFGPRGPPPDGFDPRGPPPGSFGPDGFDPRGPPPDFDGQGPPPENFKMRGLPPDNFSRGPLIPENFGPGGPPPDNFLRGPPSDEFGPHGPPFEGFGGPLGPPGEFQPRIRFELFARGRGRGQESFRGRGGRAGGPAIFSPRGAGPRGPRAGPWMESQGPSPPKPGFGFPPRGFAPPEGGPERFGPPVFEESGRGRGSPSPRGRGRGFQGRGEDRRWEDEEGMSPSPKRLSRWSNPSPPPSFMPPSEESRVESVSAVNTSATEPVAMDVSESQQDPVVVSDANKNPDNPFCTENSVTQGDRSVGEVLLDMNRGGEVSIENNQPSAEITTEPQPISHIVPAEERNFPFGGISEDSSSIQMPSSNLVSEREQASSVFQQDSQSIPDVEMSNSHYSFTESGQQSQPEDSQTSEINEQRGSFEHEEFQASEDPQRIESFQASEFQPTEDPDRRFADIGFAERLSHPENDGDSSVLEAQPERQPAEINDSFLSHNTSRRLSNEMQQNIEFSMGDSVSSAVEQSVFKAHSETGPEYDPNESSQSIHFDQRQSDDFSENMQHSNQQTFSEEEPQQLFPSFQERGREDDTRFSEEPVPDPQPMSIEGFETQNETSEIPNPGIPASESQVVQNRELREIGGESTDDVSSQDHISATEVPEHEQ